ncbi:MAG: pilus assembly protein PilM [Sedimentisphaerales bacterium]|nr:pilus assembly protein PilM [Sedimentisphaerales bacterium]
MKLGAKTVLGIDISDSRISMALLRRIKNSVKVLKAVSAPIPKGAIKDGCIEEPEVLAKAIKELKSHNKIRARKAAISLSTCSTIVHILDAPKGAPSNIGQFVQKELKSYIALSGKAIAFDFCGIKSGQRSGNRLLAVGGDSKEIALLNVICGQAHLDVQVIEPSILGYIRALYAERIEGKFDNNVLMAVLHGGVLTLCVFRKQMLDFIRVKDISGENTKANELCQWLAGEINAIIQFYDIEVADSSGKWEVTIVADDVQLPEDAAASLSDNIASAVEVRTGQNACRDTIVDYNSCKGEPSALAIGLAMGLLGIRQTGLKVNLVPPESAEVKSAKKQLVFTCVVIAVVIPLLTIAAAMGISRLADKTKKSILDRKQAELTEDISSISKELTFLNQQIELLSERPAEISEILDSRLVLDWAKILNGVRVQTPESVRITELYSVGDNRIVLEGLALTYESARLFEKTLNDLDFINLASLNEVSREDNENGFVMYKINCSLNSEKIKI